MGTWARMRELEPGDWGVLLGAAGGLAVARVTLPFVRFAASESPDPPTGEQALARAREIARLVGAAARRLPFPTTCLHRSVVLWWLLRRRGITAAIHLGTRPDECGIAAHAWVACGGQALGESAESLATYQAFDRTVVPRPRFGA